MREYFVTSSAIAAVFLRILRVSGDVFSIIVCLVQSCIVSTRVPIVSRADDTASLIALPAA